MEKGLVPGAGRGGIELKKIAAKRAETKSTPLEHYRDGAWHEYPSVNEASRALGVNNSYVQRGLKKGGEFRYVEYPDLDGEEWKSLPETVPQSMLDRRKCAEKQNWTPGSTWKLYRISNKARVKRLVYDKSVDSYVGGKPVEGALDSQGHFCVAIEGMAWKVDHLVDLVFGGVSGGVEGRRPDKRKQTKTAQTKKKLAESKSRKVLVVSSGFVTRWDLGYRSAGSVHPGAIVVAIEGNT